MINLKEYKYGAILSYISISISTISGILITPYIVSCLGITEYGLYQLIGSLLVYLGLFDFGLNGTTVRYLSLYRAKKDTQSENRYIYTIILIYTCIAILILLCGLYIDTNFYIFFGKGLSESELSEGSTMFKIVYITAALTMPGRISEGILRANEKFIFINFCSIGRYLLKIILIICILAKFNSALTIVIIDSALTVLFTILTNIVCFRKQQFNFRLNGISTHYIISILSYSFWVFIACLITSFQWQFGQISLGINTNTSAIALFSILVMLSSYYGVFAGTINSILTPYIIRQATEVSNNEKLNYTICKIGRISVIGQFIVLSNFIIFGKPFIILWLGEQFSTIWLDCCILMSITTISLSFGPANSILETRNKVKAKAIISLLCTATGASLGFIFSKSYGLYGVIYPLFCTFIINLIIMVIFYNKTFSFNAKKFFLLAYAKCCSIYFPITIVAYILNKDHSHSWVSLITSIAVYTIFISFIAYLFLLRKAEKKVLFSH